MIKSINDFYKRSSTCWRRECKKCQNNKSMEFRRNKKKEFKLFKNTLQCHICGESRGNCLIFHHHTSEKNDNVSTFINRGNFTKAYEEIKLTMVLCHNCHINIHYNNNYKNSKSSSRRTQIKNLQKWHEILLNDGCKKCGYNNNPWVLQSHHIDPTTKENGISRMIVSKGWIKILEELKKCITLCANCHQDFHQLEREQKIDLNTYLNKF